MAVRVATMINGFYAGRYPNESTATQQVRATYDDQTNTVFVQAAPADMDEIRALIERIDRFAMGSVNEMRIVPMRNAISDDMANVLLRSISDTLNANGAQGQGTITTSSVGSSNTGTSPGTSFQALPGRSGNVGAAGANQRLGQGGGPQVHRRPRQERQVGRVGRARRHSHHLRHAHQQPAHHRSREDDGVHPRRHQGARRPTARQAHVNVFKLRKADAAQLALTSQTLFTGSGSEGRRDGRRRSGLRCGPDGRDDQGTLIITMAGYRQRPGPDHRRAHHRRRSDQQPDRRRQPQRPQHHRGDHRPARGRRAQRCAAARRSASATPRPPTSSPSSPTSSPSR